jgi:hypothetical protein
MQPYIDIGVGEVEGVLVSGVDEVESGVDDVGVDDGLVVLLLPLGEPEHVQNLHLLTEGGLARLVVHNTQNASQPPHTRHRTHAKQHTIGVSELGAKRPFPVK